MLRHKINLLGHEMIDEEGEKKNSSAAQICFWTFL